MVLKHHRNVGVTLLELLVAIALSGIVATLAMSFWKDAGHAIHLSRGNRDLRFQFQAVFSSLRENLLSGKAVLKVAPQQIELVNANNRRWQYSLQDSTLTINQKKFPGAVTLFSVIASGPNHPLAEGSNHLLVEHWNLDSLDNNADGIIDQDELDRDQSGSLSVGETRFVATYQITMAFLYENFPDTLRAIVHPRNHSSAQEIQDTSFSITNENGPEF